MDEENKNKIIQNWSNINPKSLKNKLNKFLDGLHRALLSKKSSNGFRNAADFISDVLYFGPIFRKPDIIKTIKPGTIFYRARCIRNNHKTCTIKNNSDKKVLGIVKHKWTEWSMWEPPLGLPSMGRFNMKGEPFLYLSCDKNVTLDEIRANPGDYVAVSKFVVKRPIVVDCIGFHSIVNWLKDASITDENIIKIGRLYDCFFTKAFTQKVHKDSDKWKYYLSIVLSHEYFNSTANPEKIHAWKYPSMQTSDNKIYNICVKPEWAHRDLEMVNTQLGVVKKEKKNCLVFQKFNDVIFNNIPKFGNNRNDIFTKECRSDQDINYLLVIYISKGLNIINRSQKLISNYLLYIRYARYFNLSDKTVDIYNKKIKLFKLYISEATSKIKSIENSYIGLGDNSKKLESYISQIIERIKYVNKLIIVDEWSYNYIIDNYGHIFSIINDKFVKPYKDSNNYYRVNLIDNDKDKSYRIDKLVVNAFSGPLKTTDGIIHMFGKLNDNFTNLRIKP